MRHIKGLTRPAKAQGILSILGIFGCLVGWIEGDYPFFGDYSFVDCVFCSLGKGSGDPV